MMIRCEVDVEKLEGARAKFLFLACYDLEWRRIISSGEFSFFGGMISWGGSGEGEDESGVMPWRGT